MWGSVPRFSRLSQAAFCLHLLVVVTAHKSGRPSRKSYFAALMDEQGEAAANSILPSWSLTLSLSMTSGCSEGCLRECGVGSPVIAEEFQEALPKHLQHS